MDLVLVPNVGTYVDLHYIEHFSAKKCHQFEGIVCALWRVMVLYRALKVIPSGPCWRVFFIKKTYILEQHRPLNSTGDHVVFGERRMWLWMRHSNADDGGRGDWRRRASWGF